MRLKAPLQLLSESATPSNEGAAEGYSSLDSRQRSIVIGETVPIVFGKRVTRFTHRWDDGVATPITYEVGGIFVSPGATEGRFTNDAGTNELSVKLQLVLSQGDMPQLQIRDVFQRACRVGTWKQTYNQRAGTWEPGNFITAVAGTELWPCPAFCGTSGYYDNLTTLSYENTHVNRDSTWDRQVHCFVREGIIVDRLIEGTPGSSNNVCDRAIYLIKQSSRFPDALIDTATFTAAANFTETQQFYWNGIFEESRNLEDWLQEISIYFLLRVSDINGKKAFKPRLPYTEAYGINIGTVAWEFGFTEDHLLADGFEIEYIAYADRRPTTMQMLWRQQPDDDIGLIRTTIVQLPGTDENSPIEQHDMSEFCTSELHAAKVGAYLAARRIFVTHTLRIMVRPDAYNTTLALGDIVRVRLRRETESGVVSHHDYLYEVERINKSISGAVELDLMHYPIDANGRSIVALYVAATMAKGFEYPTGRGEFTCDVNPSGGDDGGTDELEDEGGNFDDLPIDEPDVIDPDPGFEGDWPPFDDDDIPVAAPDDWAIGEPWPPSDPTLPVPTPDPAPPAADPTDDPSGDPGSSPSGGAGGAGGGVGGATGGAAPGSGIDNPADAVDSGYSTAIVSNNPVPEYPTIPGDTLTAPVTSPDDTAQWYELDDETGEGTAIDGATGHDYVVQPDDAGKSVYVETRSPDPSQPDGYGPEKKSDPITIGDGLQASAETSQGWTVNIIWTETVSGALIYCSTGEVLVTYSPPLITESLIQVLEYGTAIRAIKLGTTTETFTCGSSSTAPQSSVLSICVQSGGSYSCSVETFGNGTTGTTVNGGYSITNSYVVQSIE